ncbi:MAG: hypothetical protein Q9164_003977 [Protoblastenia rupestris]
MPPSEACVVKRVEVMVIFAEEKVDFCSKDNENMFPFHFSHDNEGAPNPESMLKPAHVLICQENWNIIDLRPPEPHAYRSLVSFGMHSHRALLYLESKYAQFEYLGDSPGNVIDECQTAFRVDRPKGATDRFSKFTMKFHIIHAPGPLSSSTGHGTLGTTGHGGHTRLKIVNNGSFSAGVTRHWRNSSRFAHIETDSNGEMVSWTASQPL